MSERVTGAFPGGPRKRVTGKVRSGPPRLARVEEIEERRATRSSHRRRRRRVKRAVYGLVVSLVVGGGVGVWLGLRSRATLEEVRQEMAASKRASASDLLGLGDVDLSGEINRTLLELWRMEDVEYLRNRR